MACSMCGSETDLILVRRGPAGSTDVRLCDDCARVGGLRARGGSITIDFDALLGGDRVEKTEEFSCPECGMDSRRLKRTGRIGCLRCLDVFRDDIRRYRAHRRQLPDLAPRAIGSASRPALLQGRLRAGRLYPGLPLPEIHAPHATAALFTSLFSRLGFSVRRLTDLSNAERENLAIDAGPPASWMKDGEALVATREGGATLGLCDCDDHISFRISTRGADLIRSEAELREVLREADELVASVKDREFDRISRSLRGFGEDLEAEILLHLPALQMSGKLDRALKSALAEGWSIEGLSGSETGSAGALWSLRAGDGLVASPAALASAASRLADLEVATGRELVSKAQDELLERAGRAYGLLAMARSVAFGEGLDALSDLRLGALSGMVPWLSERTLGDLLRSSLYDTAHWPGGLLPTVGPPGSLARERVRYIRARLGVDEPFATSGLFLQPEGGR